MEISTANFSSLFHATFGTPILSAPAILGQSTNPVSSSSLEFHDSRPQRPTRFEATLAHHPQLLVCIRYNWLMLAVASESSPCQARPC
mmetsp:Transcript_3256/g.5817  ORF Transcript_3256/g.5817 Transcript_3256/m.5817 type:complete len:88 (+) Transcript_3256:550-813(+)